jgi:hypothetical protein
MKNIVSMLLTLSVVGGTAVMAAETGKETTTTTDTKTAAKPGKSAHHTKKVVHKKADVKTDGGKTKTEASTTTETDKK